MFKKISKVLLIALCVLIGLTAIIATVLSVSPNPTALVARKLFERPNITPPPNYTEIEKDVTVHSDIKYPSQGKNNNLDLYLPKDNEDPLPIILWIHGGAYVGGDKSDVRYYATALASEGHAVICMNYERAPEAVFPSPILQINEVIAWIEEESDHYLLNEEKIILAGSSAGAHAAAMFALIQNEPDYAKLLGVDAIIPGDNIKGMLLYCGPYNVKNTSEIGGIAGLLIKRCGWAFFGTRNWGEDFSNVATVYDKVKGNYPPSFITDANTLSFEDQGRELSAALTGAGVYVQEYFVPLEKEKTVHEYQFIMDNSAGKECFALTLDFLGKVLK